MTPTRPDATKKSGTKRRLFLARFNAGLAVLLLSPHAAIATMSFGTEFGSVFFTGAALLLILAAKDRSTDAAELQRLSMGFTACNLGYLIGPADAPGTKLLVLVVAALSGWLMRGYVADIAARLPRAA